MRTWAFSSLALLILVNGIITYTSQQYWGYAFRRPTIFSEVTQAKKMLAGTQVLTIEFKKNHLLVPHSRETKNVLLGRMEAQYWNEDRIFLAFEDVADYSENLLKWKQILADSDLTIPREELAILNAAIREGAFIEKGEGDYMRGDNLYGVAVKFETKSPLQYVYVGLSSDQIANDHYAFYEFLFEGVEGELVMKKRQKYYYDDAGEEYIEYSSVEPLLAGLLLILQLVVVSIALIVQDSRTSGRGAN